MVKKLGLIKLVIIININSNKSHKGEPALNMAILINKQARYDIRKCKINQFKRQDKTGMHEMHRQKKKKTNMYNMQGRKL